MPWRLIEFILIFAIFLVFIGFNLGNTCDISFGFKTISHVPVFLTAFSSFFLGMLCAVPFIISARTRRKNKAADEPKRQKKGGKIEELPAGGGPEGNSFSGDGPYGVN